MAGGDQRDSLTWVVLELTRLGEQKVEEGVLPDLLRDALGVPTEHPVFVPSLSYGSANRRMTVTLMEGYAFVASGLPEVHYIALEQSSPYVRSVLTSTTPKGIRVLSVIPDANIQEMRKQLQEQVSTDIKLGMRVLVTEGVYSHLDGEVVVLEDSDAHVRITLRSIDLVTRIPRVFLTPSEEEEA